MKQTNAFNDLFNLVNDELFNTKLDIPSFFIITDIEMKDISALYFNNEDFEGATYTHKGFQYVILCDTLSGVEAFYCFVHELVHVWQAQTGKPLNHNKTFNKKCLQAYELWAQY